MEAEVQRLQLALQNYDANSDNLHNQLDEKVEQVRILEKNYQRASEKLLAAQTELQKINDTQNTLREQLTSRDQQFQALRRQLHENISIFIYNYLYIFLY